MKHSFLAVACLLVSLAPVSAQTAEQKQATIAYVRALQQSDGGFAPAVPATAGEGKSTLRATSAALRALKYWGGTAKDLPASARFIERCIDASSGGFADQPGGKPDVFTTAVGIMAALEARVPEEKFVPGSVKYLAENVKSFDDVRIGVAGLERIKKPSPKAEEWRKVCVALLNPDGTAGKETGTARETGSVIVALLRLGAKVETPNVLRALRLGQRTDGGFGRAEAQGSDLETSYRVMRAFWMLKSKPESPDRLRAFVAKCRNADGGYGAQPGEPSTVGATYFASIILHWLDEQSR
jgi:prenyltransferase beta subunit